MYKQLKNGKMTYTQQHITDSFFNLLTEKTYEQITISEICEKAMVVRRTFYNNYESKEDIISLAIEVFFDDWKVLWAKNIDAEQIFRSAFELVAERSEFFKLLFERNIFRLAEQILLRYLYNNDSIRKHDIPIDERYREYYFSSMLACFSSILSTWIKNGYKESIDVLVGLCNVLIAK